MHLQQPSILTPLPLAQTPPATRTTPRVMARRRNRGFKKKKKSKKDDNVDKTSTKATSKVRKENKIQKLTQSMEEAQKGKLDVATKLRELRGLPELIQQQFDEQQDDFQEEHDGKDKEKGEPLLKMSQWEELLETNKKASPLPPTPTKAGLFTVACRHSNAPTTRVHQNMDTWCFW